MGPTDSLSGPALLPGPRPSTGLWRSDSRFSRNAFAAIVPKTIRLLLRRAFEFAAEQHASQTRRSGEPYLSHPLEVAQILADLRLDVTTLCAALLHDVVEDTQMPALRIDQTFRR